MSYELNHGGKANLGNETLARQRQRTQRKRIDRGRTIKPIFSQKKV